MTQIQYAAIGCGGMGRRHLHGYAKLKRTKFNNLELAAVCDLNREAVEAFADEAAELTGHRPRAFTDLGEMLAQMPKLAMVDIAADVGAHLSIGRQCLSAGLNVLCEKPLAVTVAECRILIAEAARNGRLLSVAENFRRDPMNRLVKALLDDGAIGTPRIMLEICVTGSDIMVQTPWRHQKQSGTLVVDCGVHNADVIRYYLGDIVSVQGESRLHEPVRRTVRPKETDAATKNRWWRYGSFPESIEATGEDAHYSQIRFRSGAICQWTMDWAGHGERQDWRRIFGSKGSVIAPGDRNGRPVRLCLDGREPIGDERVLDYAPSYALSPVAAELFGDRRPWRYDVSFDEVDQRILALQLHELADCVLNNRKPEVTGEEGMRDLALAFAPIESGRLGRSVTLEEVIEGAASPYQDEITEIRKRPAASSAA